MRVTIVWEGLTQTHSYISFDIASHTPAEGGMIIFLHILVYLRFGFFNNCITSLMVRNIHWDRNLKVSGFESVQIQVYTKDKDACYVATNCFPGLQN